MTSMAFGGIVLLLGLLILLLLGVPITWSLILSSIIAIIVDGKLPFVLVAQRLFSGGDSFPLLAVPAFMLAGDIMCKGGISDRLVEFSSALVGQRRGAMAMITIITCTLFASLSGSSIATAAAVGGIMCPAMEEKGYPKEFAAALTAIGGTLGPVIPPSILFIFYGNATGVSVVKLLLSGIIPGIIACIILCALAWVVSTIKKYPRERKFSLSRLWKAFKNSIVALLMPIIILGGIYTGIFTATEAAIVAVMYGAFVALFVMKTVNWGEFYELLQGSVKSVSNVMILVIASSLFAWLVAYFNISTFVATWVTDVASNSSTFLLLSILILLVAGMFLDAMPITIIMAPILHPVAQAFGIDPIHYGLLVGFTLCLGSATPPFGPALFTACSITNLSILQVSKPLLPFIICEICVVLLLAFVPILSTWLPSVMF